MSEVWYVYFCTNCVMLKVASRPRKSVFLTFLTTWCEMSFDPILILPSDSDAHTPYFISAWSILHFTYNRWTKINYRKYVYMCTTNTCIYTNLYHRILLIRINISQTNMYRPLAVDRTAYFVTVTLLVVEIIVTPLLTNNSSLQVL